MKVIVTSVKTTQSGITHSNGIKGTGIGNHAERSKVLASFDLWLLKLTENKAIFNSKKSFMEEVMIPAFTKAGSKNPNSMAKIIYPMIRKEGKIVEV